jgi:hypothetical protein
MRASHSFGVATFDLGYDELGNNNREPSENVGFRAIYSVLTQENVLFKV